MDNELLTFNSEEFGNVRSVEIEGEPWFIGADICKCLNLPNHSKALSRVDKEDKCNLKLHLPGRTPIFINEFGMYDLVLMSKKKEAKRFKRWITHEVLPSIRKHGVYVSKELLEDKEKLEKELEELRAELAKLTHKPTYEEFVEKRKRKILSINVVAADFELSAKRLNRILQDEYIQYKGEDNCWHLMGQYENKGYTKYINYTFGEGYNTTMKWTDKGCLFIADVLRKRNILPVVEIN